MTLGTTFQDEKTRRFVTPFSCGAEKGPDGR